jgi:hypothetical protein
MGHPEEIEPLMECLAKVQMACEFSRIIEERITGKIVGVRLMTVYDRPKSGQSIGFLQELPGMPKLSQNAETIGKTPKKSNYQKHLVKMFGYLINGFWMFAPTEIQKILMRGFTMVLPEYRRKGMAQHLLHYEISDDKLKVQS